MIKDRSALPAGSHDRPGSGGYQSRRVPGLCRSGGSQRGRPPRWRRGPGAALALAAMIVTAGAAGCGGPPAHGASHTPGPSPTGTTGSAGTTGSSLPTGPGLAQVLPPHTSLPPGWIAVTGAGLTRNVTAKFGKPIAELGSTSGFKSCSSWNVSLSGYELMFLWAMSWADSSARPSHSPSLTHPVTVTVADFLPGGAVKQLAWDSAFASRCHSYRDPTDGSRVTVTAEPVTGLGDQALYVQLANPYTFGGELVRAHSDVLVARAGNDMIAVSQDGTTSDPTDPVVPQSELRQLLRQYLGSVSRLPGN